MSFAKDVFLLMASQCRKAGVPFVLVGGFAVNFHNVTRNTEDVDFLMTEENFEKARPFLKEAGYSQVIKQHLFVRVRKDEDIEGRFLDIDILFTDSQTFNAILSDACDLDLGEDKIKVVSLNHLLAMKLHSLKNNPDGREDPDMTDLTKLVRFNRLDVRAHPFKELCLKYGNESIYDRILKRVTHGQA